MQDILNRYLDGRAQIEKEFAKHPSGREIANKQSDLIDAIVIPLFVDTIQELGLEANPSSNGVATTPGAVRDIAVVALGGYGRRELCPYSDVDVMILHRIKDKALVTTLSEKMFYPLWDLGLQVGHGTRTVKESLAMSAANLELQTSFLESRLIAGDSTLLSQLQEGLIKQLRSRGGKAFLKGLLCENEARHLQFGQAAYLLEPDLKEGEGGLRDIHAILWAAKGILGCSSIKELAAKCNYLTDFDIASLEAGFEFLLKIRNQLHYISERKNDRLFFEHQIEVSRKLGFKAAGGISAIEKFMRSFYTHASAIELIQRSFWEQVKSDLLADKTMKMKVFPGGSRGGRAEQDGGVVLLDGKLSLSSAEAIIKYPGSEIKLFRRAATEALSLDYKNLSLIREGLERFGQSGEPATITEEIRQDLVSLLRVGSSALPILEVMDYLGVISRYIPEWSQVRYLPQYDSYHLHTVDMHLFLTVSELQKMASGAYNKTDALYQQVYDETVQKDLLLLTGLLHDIGKGQGQSHSERGAELAGHIGKRLGLEERDIKTMTFLIANHLLLADTAQRRDLADENVIIEVAETIVDEERLKMLYLLTVADSIATGPKAWDTWKDNLLRELFIKTLHIIRSGEYTSQQSIERSRRTAAEAKKALSGRFSEEAVDLFLKQMPHSYLLAQTSKDIIEHFELAQESSGDVSISVKPSDGLYELVLIAKDQPGLFSKVCGVLAIHGLNILGAQIYTRSDGIALDIFTVSGYFERALGSDTWGKIRHDIKRALEGKMALEYRVTEKAKRYQNQKKRVLKRPAEVEVDNDSSDFYTVIEVHAEDRIGLLFTITRAMFELALDIHLAKVSTNVDKVIDVFYVWDVYGRKLSDKEQISDVKRAILAALE